MHLPPRTCPVRRISGDLRSSDPRGCGCSSCDLRASYRASRSGFWVWAWPFFSRWACRWLRLALWCLGNTRYTAEWASSSPQEDADTRQSGFIGKRGRQTPPSQQPAPRSRSLAAPKTSVQVEKPLSGPSVSTRHAVGYWQISASQTCQTACPDWASNMFLCLLSRSAITPRPIQGPLACDLLLMT